VRVSAAPPSLAARPAIRLLDARAAGLDEAGLRAWARALCDASGAAYTARSYRYPYALLGWHGRRVGVDVERVERCDAYLATVICTPGERADRALRSDAALLSLWCSKEALAKALGDALAYDPARLEAPLRWPDGRCGPWRAVPLPAPPGHVAWLCWQAGDADPDQSACAGEARA
jgi:hypothetical protein